MHDACAMGGFSTVLYFCPYLTWEPSDIRNGRICVLGFLLHQVLPQVLEVYVAWHTVCISKQDTEKVALWALLHIGTPGACHWATKQSGLSDAAGSSPPVHRSLTLNHQAPSDKDGVHCVARDPRAAERRTTYITSTTEYSSESLDETGSRIPVSLQDLYSSVHCSTGQYSPPHHRALQCKAVQCITVWYISAVDEGRKGTKKGQSADLGLPMIRSPTGSVRGSKPRDVRSYST